MEDLPVVIFCGGRGARFDALTVEQPKPLITVAGKPIIRHLVESFYVQGFREFILTAGYLGHMIVGFGIDCERDESLPGIKVHVPDTDIESHVGMRLHACRKLIDGRNFFMTYGDGLSDVLAKDIRSLHQDGKAMTVTAVRPPARFGLINFDEVMWPGTMIKSFAEKPSNEWINGGFMYVENRFIDDYIDGYDPVPELSRSPRLLEDEAMRECALANDMCGYRHYGYWRCMDTRRDLEQIETDVKMHRFDGKKGFPWPSLIDHI